MMNWFRLIGIWIRGLSNVWTGELQLRSFCLICVIKFVQVIYCNLPLLNALLIFRGNNAILTIVTWANSFSLRRFPIYSQIIVIRKEVEYEWAVMLWLLSFSDSRSTQRILFLDWLFTQSCSSLFMGCHERFKWSQKAHKTYLSGWLTSRTGLSGARCRHQSRDTTVSLPLFSLSSSSSLTNLVCCSNSIGMGSKCLEVLRQTQLLR